ncbi:hypothetical protein SCHPADRAFT_927368 [Schizopora paradoxa]|uniref:Sulfhydryl oxidase n=1 Tax=Schizopora paradoxa TaxID=27342 RepID=A0A0H2RSV0_9AGAM|nr:hypothetical protein SCHPADRAFT_927368 [Schizopora paradoxa]
MPPKFVRAFIGIIIVLVILTSLFVFHEPTRTYLDPSTGNVYDDESVHKTVDNKPPIRDFGGGVIMPKLGNETAKRALGQAAWKLMHTMTLRYPENPTSDEREALKAYFHLQARLYPCGECAAEFQQLLVKLPPQLRKTSSRRSAALWLCHVHNEVNKRLEKPIFDCAHLDSTYDCGCGDEPILDSRESDTGLDGVLPIKGGR